MSIKAVAETVAGTFAGTVAGAAGGAALSSFFDKLFDNLSSSDLLKIFRQKNVDADLKKWKRTLLKIHAVLEDAEQTQMTSWSVKIWLDELEYLVYDVDDILDEFATEALRRKLHEEEPSTSKIRKFIPACCVGFNSSSRKFDVGLRSKIEGINTRLQEIVTEREFLKLNDGAGGRTITKTSRPPTSSLVEGPTYGRGEDKNAIVKLLLESDDAQLSVIPIVGMGGLGKTTLAQLVYKDDEVSRHFDMKAWVCVSEDIDNLRLTKEILHSFTSESCDNNSTLDSLQVKLKEILSENRFLLVLDDVWCESYDNWTILRKPFESGVGSKIVVTTQSYHVSSKMGTTSAYVLKELSRDACLSVFTHHALGASDFSEYPELEKYGQKIVDRCMGAPLAAKAFGGLLHNQQHPYEWEDVLNSKIWDIPEIFSVLKLSYNRLPSHLKRCFAYCSLFPKDNEFKEKDLVLLWVAEGFVQKTKVKKPMEDLGGDYFRELLKRSFFQQSSNSESHFVMHDLMHDLAQWAAGSFYCRLEVQLGGNNPSEISTTKVRHFSYIKPSNDCNQLFDDLSLDMHLRTFMLLPLYCKGYLTNFDAKYCLLPQLRCLRVLSLSGYTIIELPSSIGDLKHLRYLNLSYTEIKSLPKSTSSLYNLQTLILEGCSNLKKLPEKIENLVNLRHLNITGASSIREMPAGIAKLKSLRTLSNFVVGKDKIVDLMNLESLQGTLCISHLENMLVANGASNVNLEDKKNLDTLVLKWDDGSQDAQVAKEILNMLRPHVTLKTLSIEGYGGETFPTWLGDLSFSNLVDLRIERCGKCTSLPAFGQLPSLKCVIIKRMDMIKSVGLESFQSLEKLCFEDMPGWEDWSPNLTPLSSRDTCFPRDLDRLRHLKKITIRDCNSLTSIGDFLPTALRILEIENCEKLEALPHKLYFLQTLSVCNCPSIESFPAFQEEDLRELKLSGANLCEQVFELGLDRLTSLTSLEIAGGIMDSFPEEEDEKTMLKLPTSVTTLRFENFQNLLSLSWKFLPNDSTLEQIFIGACPKLEPLSVECFPPSLQLFNIYECPVLKRNYKKDEGITKWSEIAHIRSGIPCEKLLAMPNCMHNPNSLQQLLIRDCPSITSFPEVGYPTNLGRLWSKGANICKQVIEWGLHRLTSLTLLDIDVFLSSKGFQNISALELLSINNCPKLASLPEKGLPPSLLQLYIKGCPVLKQHCKKGKGREWFKISHIPCVHTDWMSVYQLEEEQQ
ncbi:hypothetical protein ACB092_11G234700 [Castanea dentata]